MSYSTMARLSQDNDIAQRVTACAAAENIPYPDAFAWDHRWKLATQPGWDAAYAYAIAQAKTDRPGNDENVITDGMILSAVQAIRAAEATPAS